MIAARISLRLARPYALAVGRQQRAIHQCRTLLHGHPASLKDLDRLLVKDGATQTIRGIAKEPETVLAKHIKDTIKIAGPLSVGQYIRQALTHPLGGYYMKGDVFGVQGDFTTSPEISQMFGELVGVWFITQYQALNGPDKIQLVELGPGRGTLMSDILRTLETFPFLHNKIEAIHLVEASPHLKRVQAKALTGQTMESSDFKSLKTPSGVEVFWHENFENVPGGRCSMFIAHEFFDAMPIYKFEMTEHGWREIMVDIDESDSSPYHLRFIRAPSNTKAAATMIQGERYANYKQGERIEIAPESWGFAKQIGERIKADGGAALVVDYGRNHILGDSLRGIRKHKFTHVFEQPGDCDLSADVDFSFVADAVQASGSHAHGPITQGTFLRAMGIGTRLQELLKVAQTQDKRKEMVQSFERLVGPLGMGRVYKFLAITGSSEAPYPFLGVEDPELDTGAGEDGPTPSLKQ
ncbi:S-adenosyl-L-methionine-dependent methyltransferase [Polychytrium aggregatum]|uniref:S-adenosyl-L-methionine-dependent methyltransferase n=1 Tax=Polychytrium aggregatum TaxID=110093 RepID=UPI0022FF22EB|nr:S-adenosyl-L-methionine-dependent methyltransferase [Polychytrium aggregatum]KAI9207324.1 S-adenosyl-L-methionine-dependent methyltransferase [Polychytrium aggregatum]